MPDWNDPDTVAFFRDRDPDARLVRLLEADDVPTGTHVLDLGCAAGRNAVHLAAHGYPGVAIDVSAAMVETTRARLEPFVATGPWRVLRRPMDTLDDLEDGRFGLLLALGVLQNAASDDELERVLAHLARLAAPGARLLVANFGPDSKPLGTPLRHVPGTRYVWTGFNADDPGRRLTLPDAVALDALARAHGFDPVTTTNTVEKPTEAGMRTTVNADYCRREG